MAAGINTLLPLEWSDAAILHEALSEPRRARSRLPDTRIVERPGWWQIVTPSLRQGGLNEVGLSILDASDADEVIDRTIADYRQQGLHFRWLVGPGSAPADLAQRLTQRGLTPTTARVLWRSLDDVPAVNDTLTVEAVSGASVETFTQIMAAGWNMDAAPLHQLHQAALADPARYLRLYLAKDRGVAAGTASYGALKQSAYLMGAVVLPHARGRGLYRALIAARLRDAKKDGARIATSLARADTSAPILESMGFKAVCEFPVFLG